MNTETNNNNLKEKKAEKKNKVLSDALRSNLLRRKNKSKKSNKS